MSEIHDKHTLELEELRSSVKDKDEKLASATEEFSSFKDQHSTLEREYHDFKSHHETQVSGLVAELEKLQSLSSEFDALKERHQNHQTYALEATRQADELKAQLDHANQELSAAQESAKAASVNESKLASKLEAQKERLQSLTSQTEELKSSYEQQQAAAAEAKKLADDLTARLEETSKKLEDAEDTSGVAEERVSKVKEDIESLKKKHKEQLQSRTNFSRKIERLSRSSKTKCGKWSKTIKTASWRRTNYRRP